MARIRSIKPEFWRDEKIATLDNKLAGYFFIGLWNVADDEGKFALSAKSLSLQMPIFRSKEVVTYLSELTQKGLIRESECSQWGLVVNWNHQKIDKPKVPTIKVKDIQWLAIGVSTIARDKSKTPRRKDRIGSGSDRIGSDPKGAAGKVAKPKVPRKPKPSNLVSLLPAQQAEPSGVKEIIALYCECWKLKYDSYPPIGQKEAGMIKNLVKDHGKPKAGDYVAAYLDMNDSWYLTKRHDIPTMLGNLNAIVQYIATGKMITRKEAINFDAANTVLNQLSKIEEGAI